MEVGADPSKDQGIQVEGHSYSLELCSVLYVAHNSSRISNPGRRESVEECLSSSCPSCVCSSGDWPLAAAKRSTSRVYMYVKGYCHHKNLLYYTLYIEKIIYNPI